MSAPKTHFNPDSARFEVPRTVSSTTTAKLSAWQKTWNFLKDPYRMGCVFATWYGFGAISSAFEHNAAMGTHERAMIDAAWVLATVGVPTALMIFRKGYVSAAVLTFFAIVNGVFAFIANQSGYDMADGSTLVSHLIFAAIFAGAAWALWKRRKS